MKSVFHAVAFNHGWTLMNTDNRDKRETRAQLNTTTIRLENVFSLSSTRGGEGGGEEITFIECPSPPHSITPILHHSNPRSTRRLKKAHYSVAVLEFFGFPPDFRQFQRIAFAVAEDKQAVASQQRRQMQVVEQLLGKRRGAATDILFSVRRVGENQ